MILKTNNRNSTLFFLLILPSFYWAQSAKNFVHNNTTVQTKITKLNDAKEVHYVAFKESDVTVKELRIHFLDFDNYVNIFEYTEINKVIEKVNDTEWKVYQQHNPPWPLSGSHVIFVIKIIDTDNGFIFTTKSINMDYAFKKYKPMKLIHTIYTVEKKLNNKTLLKIDSKFIASENTPDWLFNFWFPKGPVKILENFEKEQ